MCVALRFPLSHLQPSLLGLWFYPCLELAKRTNRLVNNVRDIRSQQSPDPPESALGSTFGSGSCSIGRQLPEGSQLLNCSSIFRLVAVFWR